MSVKEAHDGAAFHMCSVILACREEFGRKGAEHDYNFLQNLLDESGISDKCNGSLFADANSFVGVVGLLDDL